MDDEIPDEALKKICRIYSKLMTLEFFTEEEPTPIEEIRKQLDELAKEREAILSGNS